MTDFIYKRFTLSGAHTDGLTWFGVALVWLLVLLCGLSSIYRRFSNSKERLRWMLLVVCLPVLGLLWYLPFSFRKEDYPFLFSNTK